MASLFNPTQFIGKAPCGCVHHAEAGEPCEHDIDLLLEGLRANQPVLLKGVDDTGKETWETTLADFVESNREDPNTFTPVLGLALHQTVRCDGFVGCYVDVTRIG